MKSAGLTVLLALTIGSPAVAEVPDTSAVIQTAELDPTRPYFIPTHPRVTTTVRFPKEIGAPDGAVSVFTEDASKQPGEYLVSWQQGDPYFTVLPLKAAPLANLNVPYQGETYVFYFYQVPDQLKAAASVSLVLPGEKAAHRSPAASTANATPTPTVGPEIVRQATAPQNEYVPLTSARLLGFLDRLKLIHTTPPGAELGALAKAMNVQIAVSRAEAAAHADEDGPHGADAEIPTALNDAGLYQIVLLRAVRDRRMNCVGFICLVRNTSKEVLTFDVNSFGARAGAEYHGQRISDATAVLKPGEQSPAYFVIALDRNQPLQAGNAWKISVDLVSPRTNPGAGIAREFGHQESKP